VNPRTEDLASVALDRAIAEVAVAQQGVIHLDQLAVLGLGERGARHRVAAGRLYRLHPAVFAVGHPTVSVDGRRIAAVLACGDGAVLALRSASVAWGVLGGDGRRFDVVAPGRSGGRVGCPKTIDLRRTRRLAPEDVTELRGIPITTVGRTLLDLAGCVRPRVLQHAVHEAEVAGLLDVDAVIATIERNPGRRGTRTLRAALGIGAPDPENGAFAAAFLSVCVDHGLPAPRLGVQFDGGDRLYQVDALFPAERLIVELDGREVHATARNFQTDRRRDSVLAARDYQTLRYTWQRLHEEPEIVVAELRRVLALRALRAV
jgi:very-short-patch-repair endonuclease